MSARRNHEKRLGSAAAVAVAAGFAALLHGCTPTPTGPPTVPPSATGQIRVATVGDSITYGTCAEDRDVGSWPARMQALLGTNFSVGNFGKIGTTMLKTGMCNANGGDCSYWACDQFTYALNSAPDIVTIMLGTNDAAPYNWEGQQAKGDSYEADYNEMIKTFRDLPTKPDIIVMVPPPLHKPPSQFPFSRKVINDIYPVLVHKIAKQNDAIVIDTHSSLDGLDHEDVFCDGAHPSDAGYYHIARVAAQVVKRLALARSKGAAGSKLRWSTSHAIHNFTVPETTTPPPPAKKKQASGHPLEAAA